MSAPALVTRGRLLAESRMGAANGGSTVTVRRKTGRQRQNQTTGLQEPVWTTVHAGLPCRIGGSRAGDGGSQTQRPGGVEIQTATRVASFPAATTGLADGDHLEVTAGENLGLVLRIVEATWQDQATARRVPVVETQRPEECA